VLVATHTEIYDLIDCGMKLLREWYLAADDTVTGVPDDAQGVTLPPFVDYFGWCGLFALFVYM
jgi:hypothetical protein